MLFKSRQGESNPELFPRPCLRHLYPGGRQRLKQQHRRAEPGSTGRDSCCPGNDLPKADPGSGERDGSPSGGTQRCPSLPGAQKEREKGEGAEQGALGSRAGSGGVPGAGKGQAHPCPSPHRERPGCGAAGGEWLGASRSDMPRYFCRRPCSPSGWLMAVRRAGLAVAPFQLWGSSRRVPGLFLLLLLLHHPAQQTLSCQLRLGGSHV